ncbi:zinc transporter [Sagittula sp. NFXS13]|uniref:ZIP family metal transporter n=1 Tax=Sagittula sp. NFXS13 TaxID=2819095 RepID=UPI0032DEB7D1
MTVFVIVLIVSFALLAGAIWGAYGAMKPQTEGFLVAMAGGALIVSVMDELIRPATETAPLWIVVSAVALGAIVFTWSDYKVKARITNAGGLGLLLAVTLDGVPENLALGTALIGSKPLEMAALAGSIFLSNLPEAAGGAKQMTSDGMARGKAVAIWAGTAALLSAAALGGYFGLDQASNETVAAIKCFAAGAVAASLATEVFPPAFRDDSYWTGIAVTCGLLMALLLGQLGG